MKKNNKLCKTVCGWGIKDVEYKVTRSIELPKVCGKQRRLITWVCPYYKDWRNMIERCYSISYHNNQPTYKGCTICEEWRYLSNFIKWVDSQPNRDWENCVPDKDILVVNNKHYSPSTVIYVSQSLNNFLMCKNASRGECLLGVTFRSDKRNKYQAFCSNPSTKKGKHIGYFTTEIEAHKAWQAKKHEYACQLADLQDDPRVAKALRERYAPDKDWTSY